MVRVFKLLVVVFWLFSLSCFGQQNDKKPLVVVIDPGHGGIDFGAIAINGFREKDIVLNIAKQMEHFNREIFAGSFEIYLTRNTDTLISLGDRAELANYLKANLFVSLHCNHSDSANTKGIEVYVPKRGEHLKESILLAYEIQIAMGQNIGFKTRGVKFGNFQVLRETVDCCPTVLLELGFLSNPDEAQQLTENENVLAIALSLLSGLDMKK